MFSAKNIFLGNSAYIEADSEYRKSLLVGVASLIMMGVCGFNWALNSFIWNSLFLTPIFITGIVSGFLVFFINRMGFYELAKHLLLISALAMLFIFISNSGKYFGAQLYLFDVIIASIFLFGYRKIYTWLAYSLLSFGCFLIFEIIDINPIIIGAIDSSKEDYIYLLNFTFSTLIIVLIIFYQIKLQFKFEEKLINKDKELKESEERFRLAVEGTNAGIWDWENINKDQQWWSPKLYELLGYKPNEIEANKITFRNLLAEKSDYPRLIKDFQNHLTKKKPFSVEYKFKCKDGSYKWFQGSGQAKWKTGEEPLRMVGSIVDITEKKQKEEEIRAKNKLLEQTNAELDRFVYSVSHDLRAPLNSIQGLINIGDTSDDLEEHKQLMSMIKNRVKKLYTFIDEIINYARNTRTAVQKEPIELRKFVEELIDNTQYRENAASIDFRINIDTDLILQSDRSRLGVVLNNLIDNSIKYHRHNSTNKFVAVTANQFKNGVLIKISDNGQGIPESAQDKIFDMFFRASEGSSGSGLGLYIVKEMVDRIGGKIELESRYGEGTSFNIHHP